MQTVEFLAYLLLGVAWRVILLVKCVPALRGDEWPAVEAAVMVALYDEAAQKVWDGE